MSEVSSRKKNGSSDVEHVSSRLIERLADAKAVSPRDLPPLGRSIDLEALDALVESANSRITVSFSIEGYEVLIGGDGTVALDPGP